MTDVESRPRAKSGSEILKKGRYMEDGVTLNIAGRWTSPGFKTKFQKDALILI